MKKNNHSINEILPPDLITEILLWLPVKSLLRFKCICKSWLSLISDPQFGVSHHDLAASPSHRIFFVVKPNSAHFPSINIDTALPVPRHIRLPTPPNPFVPPPPILGSCRGLVLLYCSSSSTRDFILWNPSIGVHKRLSSDRSIRQSMYGFGYDVSTDDYLIILIKRNPDRKIEIQVYSFKTNSWNTICIDVPYYPIYRAGLLFNGTLHWLILSRDSNVLVILAFDLIQRSLSEIPLSKEIPPFQEPWFCLREMGGCLGVCYMSRSRAETQIWVMKEYKMQSSWTKSVVILTHHFLGNFFFPICMTKDGGILGSNSNQCLEKVNDKGERLEHFSYHRLQLECPQYAPYRESLLSLPSVIGANE